MSDFEFIISKIKESEWKDKIQLTEYLLHILDQIKHLADGDQKVLSDFVGEQVKALREKIPEIKDYKEKDLCCHYGLRILSIYPLIDPSRKTVTEAELFCANELHRLMDEARPIETAVRHIFEQKTIEEDDIKCLLYAVSNASDEYEKGTLYLSLAENKKRLNELPNSAKAKLTDYLETELERYLRIPKPNEDVLNAWEVAADIAKYFKSEKICALLTQTSKTGYGNVSYYAVESLINLEAPVSEESISALAADPVYANLTYQMLKNHGLVSIFPTEFSLPEYLAKSDLIHWLTYPTELGSVPDEIEYIGEVKYLFRKDLYYVFKFRSNSDTLPEENRGKWMIGWSSENGGTFSNFDLMSDYEKPTVSQTIKNIKKNLIGR